MSKLQSIRKTMRAAHNAEAASCVSRLQAQANLSAATLKAAQTRAEALVEEIRTENKPGLMEVFLAEYGLSTQEGVALMCLAEALLRVPDSDTMDALIEDKIAPSSWGNHLGHSSSSLVNASTWALMLTGKVLDDEGEGITSVLRRAIKRVGEPVIRTAVQRAMRELGHQFVLGRDIDEALTRAKAREADGYTYSYDMLGEAALTAQDATGYFSAYSAAIKSIANHCDGQDIRENPGISVKLSALHPRYEVGQRTRVMKELTAGTLALAKQAKTAGIGFTIDAEEADRLDLSLDVIKAVLSDPMLGGWDGFGVVVQAYGKRASMVIDWLNELAQRLDRKITVRLVKGAYWDTEIKRAQVEGLSGYPVFTRKAETDVAYICCAKQLLGITDRIYPQFATHNAHTVAAILEMADDDRAYEFQRLQGMGEALHRRVLMQHDTRCRIYAPVGAHRDLLAYLVRRLLENGANSSFVNQIVDVDIPPSAVAADPFEQLNLAGDASRSVVPLPADIYGSERRNSQGWDLHDNADIEAIDAVRDVWKTHRWSAAPRLIQPTTGGTTQAVANPADLADVVGQVEFASREDAQNALETASRWDASASERAQVLRTAADLYKAESGQFFSLLTREAGKSLSDAISELREAVDFLRYYACECERLSERDARGIFTCISPWNFPVAIFTGQIAAALAAGNGVIAKPAESTSLLADLAVSLLHRAGVPLSSLQCLPGHGRELGPVLTSDNQVNGVCFTGSTNTAQAINRAMAGGVAPDAPLIAETGGLNAMIVDSTALPQQAIGDIIASAFQSAGQRCSALRVLYLQADIAEPFLEMLYGAMDELRLGNPWSLATDVGPIISADAAAAINGYVDNARAEGRVLKQLDAPDQGHFVAPTVISIGGIEDLEAEIFGPVLHLATFQADELDAVVDSINASGFGLTFGMHSRIDDRVEQVSSRLNVGNIYINRNQIGAVVGSQPFGGEGLSGTGPKAGGPSYVARFTNPVGGTATQASASGRFSTSAPEEVQAALTAAAQKPRLPRETLSLPGPTGESNRLSSYGRGTVLCLGPSLEQAQEQRAIAMANGCNAVVAASLPTAILTGLNDLDVVAFWGDIETQKHLRVALANRQGAIIPLSCSSPDLAEYCVIERHICIDTTAAGGNASLLAAAS